MGVHDGDYKAAKEALGIPEDEPIFVLRAKDDLALHNIVRYRNDADRIEDTHVKPAQEWFDGMDEVVQRFADFRNANPGRMKVPD